MEVVTQDRTEERELDDAIAAAEVGDAIGRDGDSGDHGVIDYTSDVWAPVWVRMNPDPA
jgi:hypothetical protein